MIVAWWLLELVPGMGRLVTPDVADETITYLAHLAVFAIAAGVARLAVRETLPFERGESAPRPEPGEAVHG